MKTLLLLLAFVTIAHGQAGALLTSGNGAPSGLCNNAKYTDLVSGWTYNCVSNAWERDPLNTFNMGAGGGDMLKADNLSGLANYTTARTNLGLGTLATQNGTVANFALTDLSNVSGSVNILNFPATQSVSQSGTWTVGITGTIPVSGPLTDAQLRATAVPISVASVPSHPVTNAGTFAVQVSNFPATQPVSIASMPSTPVTGPLTDTQLRASAVPVTLITGFNLEATQALIKAKTDNLDVLLSTRLKPADTLAAVTVLGSITNALPAGANLIGGVTLGNSTGKTVVMKTGTLTTTAATADQVILTYTVTVGKNLFLEYFDIAARLTTYAATATNFGDCSLESPAGTKLYTNMVAHMGSPLPIRAVFAEPIPIPASTVVRIVCTPSAATSFLFRANIGGFER